jgi:hypothetical protein
MGTGMAKGGLTVSAGGEVDGWTNMYLTLPSIPI